MSAYSRSSATIFKNLDPDNVLGLLKVVSLSQLPKKALIERRYSEHWRHFDETLSFLKSVRWINETHESLVLVQSVPSSLAELRVPKIFYRLILQTVLEHESGYRNALCRYLDQFEINGSTIAHSPRVERRANESSLRKFLAAVGMISYRRRSDDYVLQDDWVDLWIWARAFRGPKTKDKMRARVAEREQLGAGAEEVAAQYEKARVGQYWASHVHHVAHDYPFAGYDIKSVTINANHEIPRFIEVKAVSAKSYGFFWSSSEVEAARLLRSAYFLYLVPVCEDGAFDPGNMCIVEDAYTNVCQNPERWHVENNVLLCRPNDLSTVRTT
jgi:hypothetical protein